MDCSILLRKLIQIEQAIGVEELKDVRNMVIEAQEILLSLEQQLTELLNKRKYPPVINPQSYKG